ncbi:MAG: 5'-nucleotidase, lipoprotein e(P4) family [Thermoanaerobaculia bacterium]
MRRAIPLLLFTLTACVATTPQAAPQVATTPAVAPAPCDPGHSILNATLWMQTSAEYRAVALEIFANARRALDSALTNPMATGALEEKTNDPTQPPAIILDLDETVLDNGEFESRAIRAHTTYESKMWKAWSAEGAARAIPGAAEFLAYAKSRGVTPFYITNRDLSEEPGTRRNLEQLGFPLDPNVDTLLMQGKNGWTTSDKSPRRAYVAATHRILLVLGDDLNDFASASGKTIAERNAIVDSVGNWWGEVWFILPNPMYGSWERAAVTQGGTPCEQVQKKVDALR